MNYLQGQQDTIIQQLAIKIELLIQEIQKVANFSNQLIIALQTKENETNNLKQQFNEIWSLLNEKQKIWFNMKNHTTHYTQSTEPILMSKLITDVQSRVSEIQQLSQSQLSYESKVCQFCQEKDYIIQNLKEQLAKQTQILQNLQLYDQEQKTTNTYYQMNLQPQSRNRVISQKLFSSHISTTSSKY